MVEKKREEVYTVAMMRCEGNAETPRDKRAEMFPEDEGERVFKDLLHDVHEAMRGGVSKEDVLQKVGDLYRAAFRLDDGQRKKDAVEAAGRLEAEVRGKAYVKPAEEYDGEAMRDFLAKHTGLSEEPEQGK